MTASGQTQPLAAHEAARDETPIQQLEHNWPDLLPELRMRQTEVQLVTGFVLTLPRQQPFVALPLSNREPHQRLDERRPS